MRRPVVVTPRIVVSVMIPIGSKNVKQYGKVRFHKTGFKLNRLLKNVGQK